MGHWGNTGAVCPNACLGGACVACSPNATRCAEDNKTPQTCNAQGQWVSGTVCMFTCANGMCAGDCTTPGATQCVGDVRQTCNTSFQWEDTEKCFPFTCTPPGTMCDGPGPPPNQ